MIVSHYINIILIIISCLILSLNLVIQMWKIILKYPGTFQCTFCRVHYETPKTAEISSLSLPGQSNEMVDPTLPMLHHSDCFMLWGSVRLLHSPSLVAIGMSVGYEPWPPIGWHHPFVIGWSKYRLGLLNAPLHHGLMWPVGIATVFRPQWWSRCIALTAGYCLRIGLCNGTVDNSTVIIYWKGGTRVNHQIFS